MTTESEKISREIAIRLVRDWVDDERTNCFSLSTFALNGLESRITTALDASQPRVIDEEELNKAAIKWFGDQPCHTDCCSAGFRDGARWAAKQNLIAILPTREEVESYIINNLPERGNNPLSAICDAGFRSCYDWIRSFVEGEK